MKRENKKRIGIIGGMGPDASAELYKLMIKKAREKYGVRSNDDYPDIIIHSLPVPDFISNKSNVPIALKMLQKSAKDLGSLCSVLGMSCNTAHLLIKKLETETETPFIPMIRAVAQKIDKERYTRIGLLATPMTFKSKLYQETFKEFKMELISPPPKDKKELGHIVQSIVGDPLPSKKIHQDLKRIADTLVDKGAEVIVLGCTELPLVFPEEYDKVPTISSLEVFAERLIDDYYNENKEG